MGYIFVAECGSVLRFFVVLLKDARLCNRGMYSN